jgi:NAD(P)-dependent dehydrogenase (short-subunit alcohol dehydrogenase family)
MFVATLLFYCICASFITLIFMQLFYWHIRCPLYKGAPNKRLDGQTAVVTGGNTGIGFETSKDLFRRGARVIMLCQDQVQGDDSVKQLMQEFRSVKNVGQAAAKHIDLASLESVRVCAKELIAEENRIDLLILNAGIVE